MKITPYEFKVLMAIEYGTKTTKTLADAFKVKAPTISGVLRSLREKGLVARSQKQGKYQYYIVTTEGINQGCPVCGKHG